MKFRKYFSLFLILVMIGGFIYIGKQDFQKGNSLSNSERFIAEYPKVPSENFNYLNTSELNQFLDNGTGILVLANPKHEFSSLYLIHLNDIASKNNIKINYYNISRAKETKNKTYQTIINKLENHLINSDSSTQNLFTPLTIFIKNGVVLSVDNTSAIVNNTISPTDFWTTEKINEFTNFVSQNIINLGGLNG